MKRRRTIVAIVVAVLLIGTCLGVRWFNRVAAEHERQLAVRQY